MEKIINYKARDFFQLKDEIVVKDYLMYLEVLNPLNEIPNPNSKWYNKTAKRLQIKSVSELTYSEVKFVRDCLNDGSITSIVEVLKLVTGLSDKQILDFTITTFWGIISYIRSEVQRINNIEENELTDDNFDINLEAVNAKKRMARFDVLNIIDALAKGDVLKWESIENLPYMTVLTKLIMDNEKNKIQREIAELQKKKQSKN